VVSEEQGIHFPAALLDAAALLLFGDFRFGRVAGIETRPGLSGVAADGDAVDAVGGELPAAVAPAGAGLADGLAAEVFAHGCCLQISHLRCAWASSLCFLLVESEKKLRSALLSARLIELPSPASFMLCGPHFL